MLKTGSGASGQGFTLPVFVRADRKAGDGKLLNHPCASGQSESQGSEKVSKPYAETLELLAGRIPGAALVFGMTARVLCCEQMPFCLLPFSDVFVFGSPVGDVRVHQPRHRKAETKAAPVKAGEAARKGLALTVPPVSALWRA